MCPALPYNTVGGAGGLSKKVTLHQVPGSQVLPRPLVCVTAETWEKNHKYIFTVTEEMEAKSTRQKRGEAPSLMKQEGEGKGRKHLGLNIVVWVAQLMKTRKFEMCTRQPDTPILHSGPQTKAALWGAGTAGGVAAEGGTRASLPFNGCSVSRLKTKMLFCGPTLGPCPAPSSGDTVPWLRQRHLACSSPWNAEIERRFHQWILPSPSGHRQLWCPRSWAQLPWYCPCHSRSAHRPPPEKAKCSRKNQPEGAPDWNVCWFHWKSPWGGQAKQVMTP